MKVPLRRPVPQALLLSAVLVAGVVAVSARARGLNVDARTVAARAVLRWSNEGASDIYTLDPARGPDFNARQAMQLIFGGLVRFGPQFKILPDAAARWSVSRDGRTYTFTLRPNVRFGDGRALTANDVAYSLNRTMNPQIAGGLGALLLTDIDGSYAVMHGRRATARGIQVVNARVLRIRLTRPSGFFLAKLANPGGYIVPPWQVRADPLGWAEHAVGTGPFMVARWVHNNDLLLAPNPYYYAGKVQLDGIDMSFFPEQLTAFKRYRDGAVDVMGTVHFPTQMLYDVEGRRDFHQSARLETVFLTLNVRHAPFNNTLVREALAHATDRDALVSDAFGNFAQPANSMLPPDLPGVAGKYPPVLGTEYEPALARAELARAGYPGGHGLPPIVYDVDEDGQSIVLASALATQWRSILGVRVRIVQHKHSAYLKLLDRVAYQLAVIDWTADYPDPSNFISQQLHSGSPNNTGGWSNPAFDRLVDRADRMRPEDPRRLRLYHRAEEIALGQGAAIPLVYPSAGIMLRSNVRGLTISGGLLLAHNWAQVSIAGGHA